MAPEPMVVEDGVEETRKRDRTGSPWLLVVLAFGLGLALGTLISLPTGSPANVDTTESPFSDEEPRDVEATGVSSVVPDFPNGVVVLGHGPQGGLEYLRWPADGPPSARDVTGGTEMQFDATGQFLARTETVPGLSGVLLSMGRAGFIRPVRSGVTSFAWHDSDSGELAFTTEQGGVWQLFRVSRTLVPEPVAEGSYDGGSVVGWGEWGYAIQIPDGRVALLTGDGRFKDFENGTALASHDSRWVLVEDDGLKLVSAGGGVRRMELFDDLREISVASFSPDASKIGMAGSFGTAVLNLKDTGSVVLSEANQPNWLTWSSDSRFILAPGLRGVFIYDLENGERHLVLDDYTVIAVAVLPLAAS